MVDKITALLKFNSREAKVSLDENKNIVIEWDRKGKSPLLFDRVHRNALEALASHLEPELPYDSFKPDKRKLTQPQQELDAYDIANYLNEVWWLTFGKGVTVESSSDYFKLTHTTLKIDESVII